MRRGTSLSVLVVAAGIALGMAAPTAQATPAPSVAGEQLWAKRYTAQNTGGYSIGGGIALSPDAGTVFVTGQSVGSNRDAATVAYDSDGTQLWAARYGKPGAWTTATGGIVVSPDGSRVFVAGYAQATQNESELLVISYDAATGERLWVGRYHGRNDFVDYGGSLGISADGTKVFVGGQAAPVAGGFQYLTLGYDAASGARLWVSRVAGSGVNDLAVSTDGTLVFVTGYNFPPTGPEGATTVAYDADTGARRWMVRMKNPYGWSIGHRIAVAADGTQIFVTAGAQSSDGDSDLSDYFTAAYDVATGHQQWLTRYDSPTNRYDRPSAMTADSASVFVTGQSGGRYLTVAYDRATGTQQWATRYTSGEKGPDAPNAIAVGPDGVFVTGVSAGVTSPDIATVAYDPATGGQRWLARYDGPGGDYDSGSSLVADPGTSRVYVVGQSQPTDTTSDFVTIAYDTAP
jgi:PQQ-like domain